MGNLNLSLTEKFFQFAQERMNEIIEYWRTGRDGRHHDAPQGQIFYRSAPSGPGDRAESRRL